MFINDFYEFVKDANILVMNEDVIIIYHAECPDGFGAAFAAWKKFGDQALYIPLYPRDKPSENLTGKTVYSLDFSFDLEETKALMSKAKSYTLIDHHISAAQVAAIVTQKSFDLNHSGAMLAWQFFHPEKPVPTLLRHIEDNDLWRFQLPNTREIIQAIHLRKNSFEVWDKIASDLEIKEEKEKYIDQGTVLSQASDRQIEKLMENAEVVTFEGYPALMVNSPMHTSSLGAALSKKMPPLAIIWSKRKDKILISLRSNGSADVAKLAEKYGGGGHKTASGFALTEDQFYNKQNPIFIKR